MCQTAGRPTVAVLVLFLELGEEHALGRRSCLLEPPRRLLRGLLLLLDLLEIEPVLDARQCRDEEGRLLRRLRGFFRFVALLRASTVSDERYKLRAWYEPE